MIVLGPLVLVAGLFALSLGWRRLGGYWIARWSASVLWLMLTLVCAAAFYERFWVWRDCFNELGRCYDADAGVMTAASGPIWGTLALLFGALFLRSALILRSGRSPDAAGS